MTIKTTNTVNLDDPAIISAIAERVSALVAPSPDQLKEQEAAKREAERLAKVAAADAAKAEADRLDKIVAEKQAKLATAQQALHAYNEAVEAANAAASEVNDAKAVYAAAVKAAAFATAIAENPDAIVSITTSGNLSIDSRSN